jgi:hypothetical protein
MTQLNESLNYLDMENMVLPFVGIDRYKSNIGDDDVISTLDFRVRGRDVGDDLSSWFEKGYDWILDSDVSPGEISKDIYVVFVEIPRKKANPERIIELLADLETLTGYGVDQWKVIINDKRYPAEVEIIEKLVPLTPAEYRMENEEELNEWRERAGLRTVSSYEQDSDIINIQRQAGIL